METRLAPISHSWAEEMNFVQIGSCAVVLSM
jgi:hypothetical protein